MLQASESTSSKLDDVERALARISDPLGQGSRAFTRVYAEAARLVAESADRMSSIGVSLPPLAGIPISIKDLFDVRGEPTTAGSRLLAGASPAVSDAAAVERLRRAGAAIIGKTTMTEFAFSGLGLNPHYGTPTCAWDRETRRIPGGSSSGAAISVSQGMAAAAIGTDTGGSCRIPAAFNGIVGFKPSAKTVPLAGALPLSQSFDSIGPLAGDVITCAQVYSVLCGKILALKPKPAATMRLGVIRNYVLEQMDSLVANSYERSLRKLAAGGVHLYDIALPVLSQLPELFVNGGLVAAEAYHWHRKFLDELGDQYDPRVSVRIRRGSSTSAADYLGLVKLREALIVAWTEQIAAFDGLLMPTVPIVAPPIDSVANDESYSAVNLLVLRNPTVINAMDGCAISLPCHEPGDAPVGLTLAARNDCDRTLLEMALTVEQLVSPRPLERFLC